MNESLPKDVFNIIEDKEGKSRWVKVGSAFVNRDESINVYMDVLPRDGKLQIRNRQSNGSSKTKGEKNENG